MIYVNSSSKNSCPIFWNSSILFSSKILAKFKRKIRQEKYIKNY